MNQRTLFTQQTPIRLAIVQMALASALLAGCGGGGPDTSGTGSIATAAAPTFATGPITGFGSVIVNGVRFDDSSASVTDDEGNAGSSGDLMLGMTTEIHGDAISDDTNGSHSVARAIVFGAALLGPVTAIDAAARTLTILGQTVRVLDTTVLDSRLVGGFAGIAVGAILEVHGQLDATTGAYTATRVSPSLAPSGYKIRGIVANLDTTARTFTIGGTLISYASVANVPADLANGVVLRARLQTTQIAGAWVATRIATARPHVDDGDVARVRGTVSAFTSTTLFSVNGIPVDATNAQFDNGAAGIVLGAQVEVRGPTSNGVIIATKVTVQSHEQIRDDGFELHGAVTALDAVAKTFVLRGVTVSYASPEVRFDNGSVASLAVGVQLEAKGTLSADGTQLRATLIEFGK